MFENLAVKLVGWLLNGKVSLESRNKLIIHLMDRLRALPLKEVFEMKDGEAYAQGKLIDADKARQFRELANTALDNRLLVLIREQVAYKAVVGSLHTCVTPEDLYFYRAALWYEQEVLKQLESLAGR